MFSRAGRKNMWLLSAFWSDSCRFAWCMHKHTTYHLITVWCKVKGIIQRLPSKARDCRGTNHRSRIQYDRCSANVTTRQRYVRIAKCILHQKCNNRNNSNQGSYKQLLASILLFKLSASLIDHFLFICCLWPVTPPQWYTPSAPSLTGSMITAPAKLSSSAILFCWHLCTLNRFTATSVYATDQFWIWVAMLAAPVM